MSFFEQYTMGIPIFAPSLDFLTQLHLQYFFVREKSHQWAQYSSKLPVHPEYNGSARINGSSKSTLDPSDDFDARNVRYWLSLADFFTFPHVVLFDSIAELVDTLELMWRTPSKLLEIHKVMRIENRFRLKLLLRYWRRRLLEMAESSPNSPE